MTVRKPMKGSRAETLKKGNLTHKQSVALKTAWIEAGRPGEFPEYCRKNAK